MTMGIRAAHRVAAAVAVVLLVLTLIVGGRYVRAHGGWDIASGSGELMTVMLLGLGSFLALSFALLRPGPRNLAGARLTSVVWSLAFLVCLAFTWHVIVDSNRWVSSVGTTITSPQELDAYIAAHPESFAQYPYRIPTGVYLQSFEFLNSNNVEMSGFVWQKYGPDVPDSVERGVALPEAAEHSYDLTEAWHVEQNGVEEIGWYFSDTFRQNFDYSLYPFDRQAIWLRIWSPDPVEGVLPIPDFAAYRDLTPESLPGIDARFVFGAWDPIRSAFSYDLIDYNTDFGLDYGFSGAPDPEFYFNLAVERDYLSPMLEHLVLATAIALLLFFLLVLIARTADGEEEGLDSVDLTIAAGGLLFVVILDHNAIRNAVQSQTLTYLEWFPLVLDVFIVLVVLSVVLRSRRWRVPLLGYTGGQAPLLVYWPALLGTLLAVTLLVYFA
jgi:hypothetical protein